MAVNTTLFSISYTGDGATTTFALTFPFLEQVHLTAHVKTLAGAESSYTIASSVGASLSAGWSVTLAVAPPVGSTLRIYRTTPKLQPTAYTVGGEFAAKSHEHGLDRAIMILQEMGALGFVDPTESGFLYYDEGTGAFSWITINDITKAFYKSIKPSTSLIGATEVTLLHGVVPAIPKNTLAVGDVIRIKVMNSVTSGGGIIGIAVNSNGIQLYGGTGFSSGFNGFNMEYTITILSLGPSGSVDVNGAGYSASGKFSLGNYTNTIDTTVDNILDVGANSDVIGVSLSNTVCTIERL